MKRIYTIIFAVIAFVASSLNQYANLFEDYPRFHKFLPVLTSVAIGIVAIIQANYNPDGTPAVTQYTGAIFDKEKRTLGLLLLVGLMIPTLSAASCSEQKIYKKAVQANYALFVGVAATQEIVETLNKGDAVNGIPSQLSDANYLKFLQVEREIVIDNLAFRKLLAQSATLDPAKAQELIAILANSVNHVAELNNLTALHIKDPHNKLAVTSVLSTLQLSLQTAQTLLSQIKSPVVLPQPITLAITLEH